MPASHYSLLSSLPHLGELDDAPPMSGAQLLERVRDRNGPGALIETILLADDLLQREAVQSGQIDQAETAVLDEDQIRGETPLPAFLAGRDETPPGRIPGDAVWAAYFRHADAIAGRGGFLAEWVRWEVALRNALAEARARALDLEAENYLVVPQLGDPDVDFTRLLNEQSAASDPLGAMRAVDRARWDWLGEHEAWFTFGDDELAVYAARLVLMGRWQRLAKAQARDEQAESVG